VRREGLFDHTYIEKSVQGYDEVEAAIEAATPEKTAAETGLSVTQIEEAARLYATGPSLLWLGQGLQRQHQGGNIFRACAMLPAFTGNIGKPGAGFYYLNGSAGIIARKGAAPEYHAPDPDAQGHPEISQMDVPDALNDPARFRAYMVWNSNPVASNPDQKKMISGLKRDGLFTVVVDCFPTDTAKLADIMLPAASFLEFDDLSGSYFHFTVGAQVKCAEPMGESLPNQEIFRRLSKAMGMEEGFLYRTDQQMIDKALAGMDIGMGWDALKEKGWAWGSDDALVLWADGTFPTPSGKIQIACPAAEADGHPRVPQASADAPPKDGHLRLLSPAGKWLMNSSYGNDPRIQELLGAPTVAVHPEDAKARKITDGQQVTLRNEASSLTMTAIISDIIPAGTLLTDKSRWLGADGTENVNALHIAQKTDMGESTSVHGVEVELAAA